jgi:hypothetical protein
VRKRPQRDVIHIFVASSYRTEVEYTDKVDDCGHKEITS